MLHLHLVLSRAHNNPTQHYPCLVTNSVPPQYTFRCLNPLPTLQNEKVLQPTEARHQWISPEPDVLDPFLFAREEVFLSPTPASTSELKPEVEPDADNCYAAISSDSSSSISSPKSDSKALSPTWRPRTLLRSKLSTSAPELPVKNPEPIDLSEWGLSPRPKKDAEPKKVSPKDFFEEFEAPPPPMRPPPMMNASQSTPSHTVSSKTSSSSLDHSVSLNIGLPFGTESSAGYGTGRAKGDTFGPGVNTNASAQRDPKEHVLMPPASSKATNPRLSRNHTTGPAIPSTYPEGKAFAKHILKHSKSYTDTYPPRRTRGSVDTDRGLPLRGIEAARQNAKPKRSSASAAEPRKAFAVSEAAGQKMKQQRPSAPGVLTEDELQRLRTAKENLKCRLASPMGQKILQDHAKNFKGNLDAALNNLLQEMEVKFCAKVLKFKIMRQRRNAAKKAKPAQPKTSQSQTSTQPQTVTQPQTKQPRSTGQPKARAHPHPARQSQTIRQLQTTVQPRKATQPQTMMQTHTTGQPVRPTQTLRQTQTIGQPLVSAHTIRPTQTIGQPVRPLQTAGQPMRPPHTRRQPARPINTKTQSIRLPQQKPMHVKSRAPPPSIPNTKPFMGGRDRAASAQVFTSPARRRKQNRSVGDSSTLFNPFLDDQIHSRPAQPFQQLEDTRPRTQTHHGSSSFLLSAWDDDLQNVFD